MLNQNMPMQPPGLDFSENIQYVYPSGVVVQEKFSGEKIEVNEIKVEDRSLIIHLKKSIQKPEITTKPGENHYKKNNDSDFNEHYDYYNINVDTVSDISGNHISPFRTTIRSEK